MHQIAISWLKLIVSFSFFAMPKFRKLLSVRLLIIGHVHVWLLISEDEQKLFGLQLFSLLL